MVTREILDYFLYPKATEYDVPKTLLYAIVFVLAIWLVYRFLKNRKIKVDKRLAVAISPYVAFGGILRVLQDIGIVDSYLFVTPVIYATVFFITFLTLNLSLLIERRQKTPYFKSLFIVGLLLTTFLIIFIKPTNLRGLLLVMIMYLPWVVIFSQIKWGVTNRVVTLVQMFDATTTYVAVNFFGFYEQHVLPTVLINLFSPVSFIFVKLVGIVAILILIDRFSKDIEFNNYLKLIMGILGGATGVRDFFALLTLV